ncbi:MAG: adenosyl-hopene transferase HpnH [Chloroflexi bacterium]|nr:adenosyl-hopene transferase HpnH [Chloroflexota bacterium]
MKPAKRPLEMALRLAWYILKNRMQGRRRFPLVTMLEPLEMCNLACVGCGRIREYQAVLDKMMPVDVALRAVQESGAPIVSIAGGEPTIHPQIDQIINQLVEQKYFVYCCTNALLLDRMVQKIPPSKHFCWVIHLDGTDERHDAAVSRKGVYKIAMRNAKTAIEAGYRVTGNTTLFKGSDREDLHSLWKQCAEMGFEGNMISPAFDYESVPNQELFLNKMDAIKVFKDILTPDPELGIKFYNNPLFLQFLKGEREYDTCTAYSNPTYTVMGWRSPCYPLADSHTQNLDEIMTAGLWEKYGNGDKDPRCANCMLHCGFESATIFGALSSPKDALTLVTSGAITKSGITAA